MKYSREAFVQCLVEHEGYRKNVYKDTLGIDTIGIGRNLEDRGITKKSWITSTTRILKPFMSVG